MQSNQLTEIYAAYVQKAAAVLQESAALAGVWGWGDDPRNHPCHMEFYEAVEKYLAALKDSAGEDALYQAVNYVIQTAADHKGQAVYWHMYAAHGLCRELIPLLTPAHCAALRELYDARYPKLDRMPAQRELYKLLKKHARG